MAQIKPTKTVYTVENYLDWQRNGSLQLKPTFQRREVWNWKAKSLLIDTVVKGLPMPIVILRKRQDLETLSSVLEVVDGQQRLRTLFAFIDPKVLSDYKPETDDFSVLAIHNPDIADRAFTKLPADIRSEILGYEISSHVLPPDTADEVVLRIFARLNSTGAKLNHQELRNAKFFGAFKSVSYDLAFRNLNQWRQWGVFDDDDLARMAEVETVSDLLICIVDGLQGRSQAKLDAYYSKFDDAFPGSARIESRFQKTMDAIDQTVGEALNSTRLKRQALFFSLFTACYSHIVGLKSSPTKKLTIRPLPAEFPRKLARLNQRIVEGDLPEEVADAMEKATTDTGRRSTRHQFFMKALGLVAAN